MTTSIIAQAARAYANATGNVGGPGLEARSEPNGGFADMLRKAAGDTVDTLRQGEKASLGAVAGAGNLTEVVTAVSNAEATLQTVVAIRDRVIQAYQDILRMPI
jgi:flagellar hook-basal body complex protein FliE